MKTQQNTSVESPHNTTDTTNGQAKSNVYRGKAKDAYWRGYDAGLEHAQYCELGSEDYINAWRDDTLGEILGDIVEGYRQYSPFEFTASEFNRARNSETLWEAYDKGEYDGWTDGLVKRFGDPALIDA